MIIQGDYHHIIEIHQCHWLKNPTTDVEGAALLYVSLTYGLDELVEFDNYIGPLRSSQIHFY